VSEKLLLCQVNSKNWLALVIAAFLGGGGMIFEFGVKEGLISWGKSLEATLCVQN